MNMHHARALGAIAAAALLAGALPAAPRQAGASARLHRCGTDVCLLVSGRRADAAAPVLIAGHEMVVEGGRNWRVAVPLDTIRAWAAPSARSIAVDVAGGGEVRASLPIGLLGHVTELAFLDVTARR